MTPVHLFAAHFPALLVPGITASGTLISHAS
jgi:hypothetical protein